MPVTPLGKVKTNYNPSSATPVLFVPQLSDFFTDWPAGWTGKLTRTWILFFSRLVQAFTTTPIVGFWVPSGVAGVNVGPMLPSGRAGDTSQVAVVVKTSDALVNLSFDILQNGASIFQQPPVIPAATLAGALLVVTNLASTPLTVAQNDVFSISVLAGSASWAFVAQLQNAIGPSQ
jgi:hypothetical protein